MNSLKKPTRQEKRKNPENVRRYRRCPAPAIVLTLAIALLLSCGKNSDESLKKYERANKLYAANKSEQALALYRRIMDADPGFANARIMAGKILYYRRDFSGAEKRFREAREIEPANLNALLWLAKTQSLDPQKHERALLNLNAVLELNSSHIEAWMLRGYVYEARGDLEKAIASYRGALREERKLARARMRLGIIYREAKLAEQARKEFARAAVLARGDKDLLAKIKNESERNR